MDTPASRWATRRIFPSTSTSSSLSCLTLILLLLLASSISSSYHHYNPALAYAAPYDTVLARPGQNVRFPGLTPRTNTAPRHIRRASRRHKDADINDNVENDLDEGAHISSKTLVSSDTDSETSTTIAPNSDGNSLLVNLADAQIRTVQTKVATMICNSDVPQVFVPATNGTFSSNSNDGPYPAQTRSCTWIMTAPTTDRGSNYVIAVNFTTPVRLVCGSGFKDFKPRSQHAMAYDPGKDLVYIMGGTSLQETYMWDLLTYNFESNKWNKVNVGSRSPDPRYGHFAFMYKDDLYIYGGITVIGAGADIWKYNARNWTQIYANNPEKLPSGLSGSACVVVTNKLYVFGGRNTAGQTVRELNVYDLETRLWQKSDHRNSVGLAGASGVYHKATDSIYYFGGMVNQTTRNTITYQYLISQDLWYALAPRIDPLTAAPVGGVSGADSSNVFNTSSMDTDDDTRNDTVQYLPPVMYDPISSVWAPAGIMGDDTVVMYGGMRPFGPGVNEEQSCYEKNFAVYDLSCQNWTTFDVSGSGLDISNQGRVNHTMILRPPGSAGGSKTAWTAYIFGGYDGWDHGDVLNITMYITPSTPAEINNCRALRWCNLYDDCQNCNPDYCSYINGLCLFDTNKAKGPYLEGNSLDAPISATLQDLIRQRPELKSQVTLPDGCPTRTALDLANPYFSTIQSGEEKTFKVYIDDYTLDVLFEIRTLPTSALEFKTLNVWEGFMNMYWRADHGLTDATWNGNADVSAPVPEDAVSNSTNPDGEVITPLGVLNTSELMNRWTKYSGLDSSPSSSAIRLSTATESSSYISFPATDPRRFSGYYVFSLKNTNPMALSFTVTVTVLDQPTHTDKPSGTQFNMATLGFFMLGFILAVILLIFTGRKIRQLIEDRDAAHRTAEMQLLGDDDDDGRQRGVARGLNGGMAMVQADGSLLQKKRMYRIVVGVQDLQEIAAISGPAHLRQRIVRQDVHKEGAKVNTNTIANSNTLTVGRTMTRSTSDSVVPQTSNESQGLERKRSRVKSDFIQDIGLAPVVPTRKEEEELGGDAKVESLTVTKQAHQMSAPAAAPSRTEETPNRQSSRQGAKAEQDRGSPPQQGLQRGWSLKKMQHSASFRLHNQAKVSPEEHEGLTTSMELLEVEEDGSLRSRVSYDSLQEVIDLNSLTSHPPDMLQKRKDHLDRYHQPTYDDQVALMRKRNPVKVQPLSVEPLPFHSGLVPRTIKHLRRYQRYLARKQAAANGSSTRAQYCGVGPASGSSRAGGDSPTSTTGSSPRVARVATNAHQRLQPRKVRSMRSQSSLQDVYKAATTMTSRTLGDVVSVRRSTSLDRDSQEPWGDATTEGPGAVELKQLIGSRRGKESKEGVNISSESNPKGVPPVEKQRKAIKMRGRQEYEPGPLLAVNVMIVFPGDSGSRAVHQQGDGWGGEKERSEEEREGGHGAAKEDTLYNIEKQLPPMAIGTVFVPDPVRWWAYKAKQQLERRKFEKHLAKMSKKQQQAAQSSSKSGKSGKAKK
ncbi:Multiple epidermal growth factor-like domains protein 8 [Mortierella antarctica]|nr:Multiple epidermal growth factor-like domains protein 8 [Mortierella antarctica]